jgi:predicted deacylase
MTGTEPTPIDRLKLANVQPGTIGKYALEIVTDATGAPVRIPVLVARGLHDGPTMGLTAAVHGDELNGISVIHRVFQEVIDVSLLRGCVVGIPVVNVPGFRALTRTYIDGNDLNRTMPGKPDGNRAQVYAYRFLEKTIRAFDVLIDCHTASFGRINSLYLRVDLKIPLNRQLAPLMNPQIIVHNEPKDGTLRGAVDELGIPSITLEVGNPLLFQKELIDTSVNGIQRVLAHLDMQTLPDDFVPASTQPPVYCYSSSWMYTDAGGLLEVFPDIVEVVQKGQRVASLRDVYGELITHYEAKQTGIIVGKSVNPVGPSGARIVHIGLVGNPYAEVGVTP